MACHCAGHRLLTQAEESFPRPAVPPDDYIHSLCSSAANDAAALEARPAAGCGFQSLCKTSGLQSRLCRPALRKAYGFPAWRQILSSLVFLPTARKG